MLDDRFCHLRYNTFMYPDIENIQFEENEEWLKVVLPVQRNWVFFAVYTVLLITGLVLMVWGVIFTIRDVILPGERFAFAFTLMLLILLYILYRLTSFIWRQWQYYTTDREILFINKERLIVRRPVSILGLTDAYDMAHVQPFAYNYKHQGIAFQYGSQPVLFALGLAESQVSDLIRYLNNRYFPHHDEDQD